MTIATRTKSYGKRGSWGFRWQRWSGWYLTPVRLRRSRVGDEPIWDLFIFGVRVVSVAPEPEDYTWGVYTEKVVRVFGVSVYKSN